MPLTNFMYFNSHGNGPAVGSMSKKPSKAENRREQRMKIREVEIESIQNELKKPSAEVIQLKKDRKATNHQTATLKYACDLEARTQVHRILEILMTRTTAEVYLIYSNTIGNPREKVDD
jgi:hypothetical protein